MNPRIQVEHTVTEEVTDVDLVQSQIRIAAGETLADLGLHQDNVKTRGVALQCRITTEDPANGFRPDTGRITAYRSPGGAGIRLDGGTTYAGAEISAYFDSMLTKLTCRGRTFQLAVDRARRAVAEFRIRGVATNIPFLQAVLDDPDFRAGRVTTSFIEQHPQLLTSRSSADRGTRLLQYLADVTVNKPYGDTPTRVDPTSKLPSLDLRSPAPDGSRQRLLALGPEAFAADLRAQPAVAVTDTTMRDAHQSLLATRVRTRDLTAVAGHIARLTPELLSLEAWGGATYDVALRFLAEDPWERLAALREAVPNICLQMLLRGRNTVGYTPYPTEGHRRLRRRGRLRPGSTSSGSSTRSTTSTRCARRSRPSGRPARHVAEVCLCYTGDLSDPAETLYTLDYYLASRRADRRRRRARAGDQGHGRPAPGSRGAHPGRSAAGALRPAGAPAHARHSRRPARDAGRGDRRRGRRRRRGERGAWRVRRASRRCRPWWRPPTELRARPVCR